VAVYGARARSGRSSRFWAASLRENAEENHDFGYELLLSAIPVALLSPRTGTHEGHRAQWRAPAGGGGAQSGLRLATFHTTHVFLNRVTGVEYDTITGTPDYKVTAVEVEKVTIGTDSGASLRSR